MKCHAFTINREYEISCKFFCPDDENIQYIIIGVHGFAGDKDSSVLEKLAEDVCLKKCALICFDFPAHGKSPVNEDMLTVENCKKDLSFVVDYVADKYPDAKKYAFATSFGGYITLLCLEKLRGFSLVLRAPAVTMPKVLLDNVLQISAEDFKKAKSVSCGFERPINLPYSFYEELTRQSNPYGVRLSVPTLVIHGDCDDVVPPEDVLAFVKAQDNISLEIMRGADHRFKNKGETENIIRLTTSFLGL